VKAATSKFFRGFSLRLALKEPLFTGLTPLAGDSSTQSNYVCVGYGAVGITHTNNNTKTVAKGNLTIAKAASNVPLDVIIVVQNRNKKSIYYYTEYKLTFA
jgi:Tfp pilus tip-associated adhesin PilY1